MRRLARQLGRFREIGGSPRKSGTALEPREIAEACKQALRSRSPAQKATAFGVAVALAAVVLLVGKLASWLATESTAPLLTPKENFPFAFGSTAFDGCTG